MVLFVRDLSMTANRIALLDLTRLTRPSVAMELGERP